jgi:RimJ/RimL family protein N-acetyltransferase
VIETERLRLRKPTEADLQSPPPWLSDPEVMEWIGGIELPPAEVVQIWLEQWERFPAGKLLAHRREDGALIGVVSTNYYDPETWMRSPDGVPELGWALAREHWGHGYASEAALAYRDWLAAPRIISLIAPGNLRSQAVAERLGARPEQTIELPGYGDHVVWLHP